MRVKTGNVVMRVAFERQKVIPGSLENRNFLWAGNQNYAFNIFVYSAEYKFVPFVCPRQSTWED
jgi:hypothetical protein